MVPDHIAEVGRQPDGITVLKTPIGSAQNIASKMEERMVRERMLLEAIPMFLASNARWQILLQNVNPRVNQLMRTLPPTLSRGQGHCPVDVSSAWSWFAEIPSGKSWAQTSGVRRRGVS